MTTFVLFLQNENTRNKHHKFRVTSLHNGDIVNIKLNVVSTRHAIPIISSPFYTRVGKHPFPVVPHESQGHEPPSNLGPYSIRFYGFYCSS